MANRTIYVSNILSQLPQEVISAFFSSCGTITNFKLAGRADQPTRYAFIEFAETAHAHSAISLSGTDLAGRKLKITMSHSPINSPPSSSNSGNNRNNNSSSSSSSSSSDSHHQNRSHHHSHHRHQRSNNDHSSPSPSNNSNNNINSSSNSSNNSNMNNVNIADAIERTVYVTNIDSQLKEEQLCEFFTYCGQINHYKICGDGKQPTRFAFFEFASRQFVNDALCLNDQFLGGHKIKVSKSRTAIQPNSQPQNNNNNNQNNSSSMNTSNNSNSSSGNQNTSGGNNTSKNNNAQNYSTPHYQDQIGRTVYVGNVDVSVTEDDLYEFFNQLCGSVVKVALAGDSEHAARFAFVEFATTDSRNDALTKTGKILCNRSIRVNASRTPILGGGKTYSAGSAHYSNASSNQDQYIDASAPIRENTDWDTPAVADDDWSNHNHHNSKRKRSNESDDSSDSDCERETEHHNKKMRMEPSDGGYAVALSPNNNNSNYSNDDDYDNKW